MPAREVAGQTIAIQHYFVTQVEVGLNSITDQFLFFLTIM